MLGHSVAVMSHNLDKNNRLVYQVLEYNLVMLLFLLTLVHLQILKQELVLYQLVANMGGRCDLSHEPKTISF